MSEIDFVCRQNVANEFYRAALNEEISKETFLAARRIIERARAISWEEIKEYEESEEVANDTARSDRTP